MMGAQLNPPPLNDEDPVDTRTVIGKHAEKPMVLESPIYISHMSFGALSKETKIAPAVSYTHLDVYKRQVSSLPSGRSWA